jgi:dTDP-4-dehydrorhamnose 3,5-epimerase
MTIKTTPIEGLLVIEPKVYYDDRGYFLETYNESMFKENGIDVHFGQDNQSMSIKGVVRGLHFQKPPFAQAKLIRVIKGAVRDVVVDIRRNSATYGKYFDIELTEDNFKMLYIPIGFAHGFLSLENYTIFSYKCSNVYNKESECTIRWNDVDLNINWNIDEPILSDKDINRSIDFKNFVTCFD